MKKKFFALAFFALVILTAGTLYAGVENVGDWWGKVTINGNSGNNGAVIDAYISGNKVASAIVGEYETDYYLIHVEGNAGDKVLFKVNGEDAITVDWSNGDHRKDLSVTIQESSSSGSSSSGGSPGGGGGSSSTSSSGSSSSSLTEETGSNNIRESSEEQTNLDLDTDIYSGITGAVIGFIGKPIGKAFLIILILGLGVIGIKYKPLKKWTEKP